MGDVVPGVPSDGVEKSGKNVGHLEAVAAKHPKLQRHNISRVTFLSRLGQAGLDSYFSLMLHRCP